MIPTTFGLRHVQVFMMVTAITVAYILRVNMSVAIVAMTNNKMANENFQDFDWSEPVKGTILSAFFWGYMMFQIIMGNLGEKFGTKTLLLGAMTFCSLITILTPFLADLGSTAVIVSRVLMGAAQGAFYPCVTVFISKWVPLEEQGNSYTLAFSGSNVGTLIGLPLSGFLAASSAGWPSIFYVSGAIGILWSVVFLWVGASTPDLHHGISEDEKQKIKESLQNQNQEEKLPTPWREIATSLPLWAVFIAHLGQNWGFWTLLTEMPNYISSVLKFKIKDNGFLSCLPYLAASITAVVFSSMFNRMVQKNVLPKTTLRKIFNTVAFWGCGLALFILALMNTTDATTAVFLLTLAVALDGAIFSGFITNHVDLSPNFCGTLMGITNSLANITSILGPLFVGWIVENSESVDQWKKVFFLSAGVMFATNFFYVMFGTSEQQYWNNPNSSREKGQKK
ncbi:putative inorganic phosphate cotransporter isoform X2 [Planococcus citri]|uniref:putative inorganic phosphate cotransporter isoform X2 n=1 Tax=Planococcus citri TaxID=170843 RepID=UPI0031F79564